MLGKSVDASRDNRGESIPLGFAAKRHPSGDIFVESAMKMNSKLRQERNMPPRLPRRNNLPRRSAAKTE